MLDVLVTCKYKEDMSKSEGARVFITLYINFSDAQGQITLELMLVSGRNLNLSKLSFLQVTRTCMKALMSSNSGQIPPPTPELSALACLKNCCIML